MTRRPGFTFIEVLLTLFLLALSVAIALPAVGRGTEGLRVRAEVAGFSAFLRRAREQAITRQEVRIVTVHVVERVVVDENGEGALRGRRHLPDGITIEPETAVVDSVLFSPEGLSSGGTFRLAANAGSVYRVTVSGVTGRVSSRRGAAP